MDIDRHIINTIKFYLDIANNTKLQIKEYIIYIIFELLIDKNTTNVLLKFPKLFYCLKDKCKEFLNDQYAALQWFSEKMKFYDNIISKLELELLNNT